MTKQDGSILPNPATLEKKSFSVSTLWSERKAAKKFAQEQKRLEKLKSTVRTPEEISSEYAGIAREAGEAQFKIETLKAELQGFNNQMFRLHQEYLKAVEVHKDTPPAPTQAPTTPEAKNEEPNTPNPEQGTPAPQ